MFSLQSRVAVVTGAGSGIGAAIAQIFARAGACLAVLDRDDSSGLQTVDAIRQAGGKAEFVRCDVSQESEVAAARDKVINHFGRCDVLVNNAGIGCVGTILQTPVADLDRMHAVNVRGVFLMSQAFLPRMLEQRSGVILNMASIGGVVGVRDRVAYCATKFAVVGITKAMALDHARQGIRINCICPGRVETPFVAARLKEYPDPKKAYEEMSATQAVGRMAKPEEIAAAALYLASEDAAFITGSHFLIDGGWSVGK